MSDAERITLRRGTLEDGFATYQVLREAVNDLAARIGADPIPGDAESNYERIEPLFRHLAPGRAILTIDLEDAPALTVELTFPEPALEPDWIARLLIGRMEAASRTRHLHATSPEGEEEEARVVAIGLAFDRLSDPAARQLPAFQVQAGRWEELRWSLERLATRFGEGRLWRARTDRPNASLPERQEHVDPRPVGQLRVHLLLVPRASAYGVPAWLDRRVLGHRRFPLDGPVVVPHLTPLG